MGKTQCGKRVENVESAFCEMKKPQNGAFFRNCGKECGEEENKKEGKNTVVILHKKTKKISCKILKKRLAFFMGIWYYNGA